MTTAPSAPAKAKKVRIEKSARHGHSAMIFVNDVLFLSPPAASKKDAERINSAMDEISKALRQT